MKKKIAVLAAMLLIVSTALFAVEFKAVVGQETTASLEFKAGKNANNGNPFRFNINAELDMDFNQGHGMLIELNPRTNQGGSVEFACGFGYAYQDWVSNNTSFVVGVGPSLVFASGGTSMGVFATIDFDFHVSPSMFVRVGTGVRIDFGEFGDEMGDEITFTVPLPAIGFGWQF